VIQSLAQQTFEMTIAGNITAKQIIIFVLIKQQPPLFQILSLFDSRFAFSVFSNANKV
jgi:hypothetical protein